MDWRSILNKNQNVVESRTFITQEDICDVCRRETNYYTRYCPISGYKKSSIKFCHALNLEHPCFTCLVRPACKIEIRYSTFNETGIVPKCQKLERYCYDLYNLFYKFRNFKTAKKMSKELKNSRDKIT